MMFSLHGRKALITGGTQGVGAGIAKSLASAGADLFLLGLEDNAETRSTIQACRQSGVKVEWKTMDLSGPIEESRRLVLDCLSSLDWNIDLLVNNVGVYCEPSFLELDIATYERTMRLNVGIGLFLTQALAKQWIDHHIAGRILFTGSINGILSEPQHVAYDTSKGAVAAMVRSLCVELAPHGIRVNGVAPGLIETSLTGPSLRDPTLRRWMEQHTPNGLVPLPDAIGPTAVFLLSDEAYHLHGQMLYVDGGMSAWQQGPPPHPNPQS